MSNCNVTFWKDTDDTQGTGHYKNYDGPQNVPDLNEVQWHGETRDDMKDDISWVDTSSQTWVRLFSKANYSGRTLLIGPNQHVNLKYTNDENDEDDMNDTVESFQLYDHKPDVDAVQVNSNFVALYPGSVRGRLNNLYNSEWYAQDSKYRVYDPTIILYADKIAFTINLDHVQAEGDDHAVVTFSMDYKGDFVDHIQVSYDMANAAQIPDWAIKLIDGAIDLADDAAKLIADGAEIVITDGVGVVATVETNKLIDYTAKALTFCIDHLNTVLKAIFKFQDDGGTMYFSAIVSHAIARQVLAYYEELYGADTNSKMSFDTSAFLRSLGASQWGPSDKHNPYVEFSQDSHPYRAFYPDNTFLYARGGAVSSVKVTAVTNNQKDDHLTLQCTYDPHGNLFSVAGGVDLFLLRVPSGYTAPTSGVITYNASRQMVHITPDGTVTTIHYDSIEAAYADIMASTLSSAASTYGIDLTSQQRSLVDASSRVLSAITGAI
ncbi:MAG TPA: hypothetical protein VFR81_14525 [Longimicrobium sp.]|nr:hypothetical protein [Longimicrobium sp.]